MSNHICPKLLEYTCVNARKEFSKALLSCIIFNSIYMHQLIISNGKWYTSILNQLKQFIPSSMICCYIVVTIPRNNHSIFINLTSLKVIFINLFEILTYIQEYTSLDYTELHSYREEIIVHICSVSLPITL